MSRYHKTQDGETLVVPLEHKVACCDCGLVHRVKVEPFRVETIGPRGGKKVGPLKLRRTVWRDERATAAVRRERRKRGESTP